MNIDLLLEPLQAMLRQVGEFLPRLALVLLVLVAGYLIAKAVRFAVVRGLSAINFNILTERAGVDGFLKQGGMDSGVTGILGMLMYWLVILATLVIAFNSLGLTYITDLLGKITQFLPNVIAALLILVFGTYFARFVGNAITAYCSKIGVQQDADLLGNIARYALVVYVVLIALDQMNIGGSIVRQTFLILLTGIVFSLSLAFGLGGKRWAGRLLERWWPTEHNDNSK